MVALYDGCCLYDTLKLLFGRKTCKKIGICDNFAGGALYRVLMGLLSTLFGVILGADRCGIAEGNYGDAGRLRLKKAFLGVRGCVFRADGCVFLGGMSYWRGVKMGRFGRKKDRAARLLEAFGSVLLLILDLKMMRSAFVACIIETKWALPAPGRGDKGGMRR